MAEDIFDLWQAANQLSNALVAIDGTCLQEKASSLVHSVVVMQAGGVLLACADSNVSSAAVTAVINSLSPGCGHCLQHFSMHQLAAIIRANQGSELAGQAQKGLVAVLQGCSHAVVVVEGIEATPSALLPVLINLLSEHGHFEHDGSQVPAYKALVLATVAMPTADLQKVCLLA